MKMSMNITIVSIVLWRYNLLTLVFTCKYIVKIEAMSLQGVVWRQKKIVGNVTVLAQYSDYLEFAFLLHGISFTFFYLVQV